MNRREFVKSVGYSLCAVGIPFAGRKIFGAPSDPIVLEKKSLAGIPKFEIPTSSLATPQKSLVKRIVLVRYGGGVRPEETITQKTESPFLYHGLLQHGTLFSDIWIDRESITGHAQGTLYISTGRFDSYPGGPFDKEYIPQYPTLAEYIRKHFSGNPEDAVIINNSDNMSTEQIGYSQHSEYGAHFGPVLLSEWALKIRRIERRLPHATGNEHEKLQRQLKEQLKYLYRDDLPTDPKVIALLDRLDKEFGERPPRGDDLVAEFTTRALQEFRPLFIQIHLQDSDYVHWGPKHLYQRGVRRMDSALHKIWQAIQIDPSLRDETAIVIVPDHGRNVHGSRRIPYQHHDTDDPGSHRIFAFFAGPGIPQGKVIADPFPQVDVTPTIGSLLGIPTPYVHGRVLPGVIA